MTHEQILKKFKRGDFILASEMLGVTPVVAKFSFKRRNSKKYDRVKQALIKIIENREELIIESSQKA